MATTNRVMLYPYTAERNYQRLLLAYVKSMEAATLKRLKELELLRLDTNEDMLTSVFMLDGWSDDLTATLFALLEQFLAVGQQVTLRLPEIYAQVNQYNDKQWRLVVKAGTGIDIGPAASMTSGTMGAMSPPGAIRARFGVGVDVYRSEPWLAQAQTNWVAANTSLIKSIPTQYMAQVEQTIRSGVLAGESPRSLAKKIQAQGGVTERRATIIARDQVGRANAELNQYRQTDLGIKRYKWVTSHDERVRGNPRGRYPNASPSHYARDGKFFEWSKPPEGGHAGMAILCRCHSAPDFDSENEP